jgi:hypothetical protein
MMLGRINEEKPSLKDVYDVSYYISTFTFFNLDNEDISKVYEDYIVKLLSQKVDHNE